MTDGHPQNTVNVSTFVPEGFVFIGFLPEDERAIASQLIAAAGDNYGAVMAQSGGFLVPLEVAEAAGLAPGAPVEVAPVEAPVEEPAPAPAKKAAAKAADPTDTPAS